MPPCRGERARTAKLTESQVLELRQRHHEGEKLRALARDYPVSPTNLTAIVTGQTWTHVGGPIRAVRPHRVVRDNPHFCPICSTFLEVVVTREGKVAAACVGCERRRQGRCMDCGVYVHGSAWRCPPHKRLHLNHLTRECDHRHGPEYRERDRQRYWQDPILRRQKNDQKKEWRAKNPRKVLLHRRKQRLAGRGGFATHQQYVDYHAAYRAAHREERARRAREVYRLAHPERPDPVCLVCGASVPWYRGRPASTCEWHNIYKTMTPLRSLIVVSLERPPKVVSRCAVGGSTP